MRRGAHVSVAGTARAVTAPDPCPQGLVRARGKRHSARGNRQCAIHVPLYRCGLILSSTLFIKKTKYST